MKHKLRNQCTPCISCIEPMDGIYDDTIRNTCNACGGESLVAEERAKWHKDAGGVDRYFKTEEKIKTRFSL